MNPLSVLIPRPQSATAQADWADVDDFDALVASIETLLFTLSDHASMREQAVLNASLQEVNERWPESA